MLCPKHPRRGFHIFYLVGWRHPSDHLQVVHGDAVDFSIAGIRLGSVINTFRPVRSHTSTTTESLTRGPTPGVLLIASSFFQASLQVVRVESPFCGVHAPFVL